VNNAIYGMTGGQMAPTTLAGQRTATSPIGRDTSLTGHPLKISELLSRLESTAYIERVSVHDVKHILKAKKAIRKGIEYQLKGLGYSFIEVLSTCPTNWGMSPTNAAKWVEDAMMEYYPLGVFKDAGAGDKLSVRKMTAGKVPAGKER
jgi:2-oxoglutarate ferredoxin oxidoreductase subunit beta